jgi:hypothetical protein
MIFEDEEINTTCACVYVALRARALSLYTNVGRAQALRYALVDAGVQYKDDKVSIYISLSLSLCIYVYYNVCVCVCVCVCVLQAVCM